MNTNATVLVSPADMAADPQPCLEVKKVPFTVKSCHAGAAQGDLIPWTVTQQFQDADFAALSGARVVRIAVHPDMARAGYGSRALELLAAYFQGELADLVGLNEFFPSSRSQHTKIAPEEHKEQLPERKTKRKRSE
jgi:N-acetyltransferase 10